LKDKNVEVIPTHEWVEFMKIDPKTGYMKSGKGGILECFKEGTGPIPKTSSRLVATTDFFKFDMNLSSKSR